MSYPRITIIIPVYNAATYLERCIISILNQTIPDYHCLLLDDGSTDGSGDICEYYSEKDDRFKVYHYTNSGPGKTRNRGIQLATTQWICFIDSDDWLAPDYLENFLNVELTPTTLVIQGMEIILEDTQQSVKNVEFPSRRILEKDFSKEIIDNNLLLIGYPVLKLFNRDILLKNHITFPTDIHYHEDHIFYLRYLRCIDDIQLLSGNKYKYMIHKGSLTSKLHPYQQVLDSFIYMNTEIEITLQRLGLSFGNNIYDISSFLVNIYIRALVYCYRSDADKNSRLSFLNEFISYRHLLQGYTSHNKIQRTIVWMLKYLPHKVIDRILRIYIQTIQ